MYQPRRVADPIETVVPTVDPISPAAAPSRGSAPRRAAPSFADRVIARGGITLAVVTVAATAGAVAFGSNGGTAVALGVTTPQVSAGPDAATAAETPTQVARTLTADELAAPAAELAAQPAGSAVKAKKASRELVSLARLYTTGSLNVRAEADSSAELLGTLAVGDRVSATSDIEGKYRKVEFDAGYGWVLEKNLSDAAPVEAAGTTWAACSRGSAVESRLRKDTVHIYRSVCALFPAVNSYGGWRAGGLPFHKNGRALDIMLTPRAESALGHRIANYLIKHAADFKIDHIIFEQRIWTPRSPHWRHMADRGSLNANHFNHVHVAIRA
ncbi:MAG: SH3 domain-containing protein [Propionibacteriaceae bacterium]|nr:SH3 domain-containing protein [Propionibacteriaceae bacterium]